MEVGMIPLIGAWISASLTCMDALRTCRTTESQAGSDIAIEPFDTHILRSH